jgi:hypothetical protein
MPPLSPLLNALTCEGSPQLIVATSALYGRGMSMHSRCCPESDNGILVMKLDSIGGYYDLGEISRTLFRNPQHRHRDRHPESFQRLV